MTLEVIQNSPMTLTLAEEREIVHRLKRAKAIMESRFPNYRAEMFREIVVVNRILRAAIDRGTATVVERTGSL